jgi:predicted Zn-dependent protease
MRLKLLLLGVGFSCALVSAQQEQPAIVLKAMKAELDRSIGYLKTQGTPPYFLSYSIVDQQRTSVRATFGVLQSSGEGHTRQLALGLRVGDYSLDNTHEIRGDYASYQSRYAYIAIPIEDNSDALRTILWLATDTRFKRAVDEYTKVKTNKAVKVKEEDVSDDFSHEQPSLYIEKPKMLKIDRPLWEAKLKNYTRLFREHPNIFGGDASMEALVETKYFISSEGTMLQTSATYVRLMIYALSKADDGMELPRFESFFAFSPDGMPTDEQVIRKIQTMIDDLEKLRVAPLVDPYSGPAILTGGAAGVFFHEVLGHRVEGHRQKLETEGQTFKKKLGERVLADSIDVVYDPTSDHLNGSDLSGYYKYDDEGVKAQRVAVIENGILKRFLMGRTPIEKFSSSNGHGRGQAGFQPVSRQSNLIIQSKNPVPSPKLRQMLIDECLKKQKPYGLLFAQIEGGFTMTGRTMPNSFNVLPLVVYRVHTDGRPDELVRGVDLVGTPLTVFGKVTAAGDDPETWYGYCGAESGSVPVSQTCPSIFVSEVEVQKKDKSQDKPPILPAPFAKKAN